jgi:signal transduction histidine kinase
MVVSTVFVTALILATAMVSYATYGIRNRAAAVAQHEAAGIASVIAYRAAQGEAVDRSALDPYMVLDDDGAVVVTMPDGTSMTFGQQPTGPKVTASAVKDGVTVNLTQAVGVVVSQSRVAARIATVTLLSVLLAFAIAYRRSRRLTAVFERLSADALRIGGGDMRPAHRYGMAELDDIADALDASAGQVANLITQERESVRDVAHQLRTPLTAIELRLDEVIDAADREDYAAARNGVYAAQKQMDRLNDVIDDLLAARHGPQPSEIVCLSDLVRQLDSEWGPRLRRAERTLRVHCDAGIHVRGAEGPLRQIVGTLIDNALVHGSGVVTVTAGHEGELVALRVADQGQSIDPSRQVEIFARAVSGAQRSGLGLAVARSLAEYLGGRLELISTDPTEFALLLAAIPAEGVHGELPHDHQRCEDATVESSSASARSAVSLKTQRR